MLNDKSAEDILKDLNTGIFNVKGKELNAMIWENGQKHIMED